MSGLNNDVTIDAIIERCMLAIDEKRRIESAREAKETRRFLGSNLSGWVAIGIVVVTAISTGKSIHDLASDAYARSIKNENAIVQMRVSNSDRLARIETKVDRILEERSK